MSLLTRALSPVRRGNRGRSAFGAPRSTAPDDHSALGGVDDGLDRTITTANGAPADVDTPVPEWVGTDRDPAWRRVEAEVARFAPMRDVRRSAQDCQVAVARLAGYARLPDPAGRAATGALHGLALDLQHECHRLTQPRPGTRRRPSGADPVRPPLRDWLLSPVGSGRPRGNDLVQLRDIHRITMTVRLAGAVLAAALLAAGRPWPALAAMLVTVTASGIVRYRTNAEAAVTFRARYYSCLCGHAGDMLVLIAASVWLLRSGEPGAAVLPAITGVVFLFGTATRTGALQVGVNVPRLRMERTFRVAGLVLGIAGAALGYPAAFAITLATAVAYAGWEISRAFGLVWTSGPTEFAWTAATRHGFVTEVQTAPPPDWPRDPAAVPDMLDCPPHA